MLQYFIHKNVLKFYSGKNINLKKKYIMNILIADCNFLFININKKNIDGILKREIHSGNPYRSFNQINTIM